MPAGQLHIGLMTLNHISERERGGGDRNGERVREKETPFHSEKERERET